MKLTLLLSAEVRDDAPGLCASSCPHLDAGIPPLCLLFERDNACVRLDRDEGGKLVRCRECVLAGEWARIVLTAPEPTR